MDKVEEVARAIYEAEPYVDAVDAPIPWAEIIKCHGFLAGRLNAARAAIEAMRTPTEAMVAAVRDPRRANGSALSKGFHDTWQTAIDAALSDEWALWLQEHADYGIEFKAVQIAEALDSMHRGALNTTAVGQFCRHILEQYWPVGQQDLEGKTGAFARGRCATASEILDGRIAVPPALRARPVAWMRYVDGAAQLRPASDEGDPPEDEGWIALYRRRA